MDTNSRTKPKILWIHGWSADAGVWEQLAECFPEAEHRFLDFSAVREPSQFNSAIDHALCSRSGAWMVVGWSMGAMLALQAAFPQALQEDGGNAPYRIDKLVLIGGTLRFVHSDRTLGWPERVLERMKKKLREDAASVVAEFRQSMLSPADRTADPSGPDVVLQGEIGLSPAALAAGLDYLTSADLRAWWQRWITMDPNLRAQTLWIHGSDDPICPAAAVPQGNDQYMLLEGAGHAPFLTRTEETAEAIRRFINA